MGSAAEFAEGVAGREQGRETGAFVGALGELGGGVGAYVAAGLVGAPGGCLGRWGA